VDGKTCGVILHKLCKYMLVEELSSIQRVYFYRHRVQNLTSEIKKVIDTKIEIARASRGQNSCLRRHFYMCICPRPSSDAVASSFFNI
jgi:hypothetical protein